uniref:Adenylate-forming reductase Nps11 n=3 Tax=Serpula lacrymans var. lacrymans TaxID=341189 RepID=NPS11_SERL9|nr:RecName: Full=Adenylate-forming reductase Nps11; AltName: Full=Benzoic acid reductase; AltName: Full=Nonribosomal peptide synthase-like enzyme 11; Short=NRPS-like [Serpula lacrymans var. lacrymans S7.9]ANX99775.1 benzoic acid reductase [Serpula lacrymans]
MADPSFSYTLHYPPVDGSLLFPEIIAFNAEHNSNVPFFVFPEDGSANGVVSISHLEFYRACHRVAHALRPNRAGPDGEIIAIIAMTDTIQYFALLVGVIIAGYIPFPMSPRNSAAAVSNLLLKTSCHRLITTQHSLQPLLDGIKSELGSFNFSFQDVPCLAHIYPKLGLETIDDPFEPFPARPSRPSASEVMMYLHSSGSTGFPKAIPQTHQTVIHWCAAAPVVDTKLYPADTCLGVMLLPSFHTLGIICSLYLPLITLRSVSVYAPTSYNDPKAIPVIPTSENILEGVQRTNCNALMAVPAFIELWALSPSAIEILKSLRFLASSGGPLSEKVGNALASVGVPLVNVYGGTECGGLNSMFRRKDEVCDWVWINLSPRVMFRWVPQGEGLYECQILQSEMHRVSVENLPDVKGYATSDIFLKHPTKEGLWKLVGRKDDIIVLSSGEKTVPAPMENTIASNPVVGGTVMFGRARNHVGILIEPRQGFDVNIDDPKQVAAFRNRIWPEVEEANKAAAAFSRIFKEMILITRPDKPLPRTGKGTVMRKAAVTIYDKEIDALYDTVEASTTVNKDVELPKDWSEESLVVWLGEHAARVNSDKKVDPEVDVFEQGFDSLTATFLRNRIIGSLSSSTDSNVRTTARQIDQNIVFSNPTIKRLSQALARVVSNPQFTGKEGSLINRKVELENTLAMYSEGLPGTLSPQVEQPNGDGHSCHVVLLTGSTGGLGSYLLASLLENEQVSLVYAFNRSSKDGKSSEERQKAGFEDRGLDIALLSSPKLRYIEGDAAQDKLGLGDATYDKLRTSINVIIHNAWRLDFSLSLSSFGSNIKGTRNLVDLALSSPNAPSLRFLFTSSISSAQGWDKSKGACPEEVLFDANVASGGSGYGASKYVCERILEKSGLQASSFRIGQISGGQPRGAWSVTDWFPMLVKSSLALGALPVAKGVVSWLPPHAVSQAILDVAFAKAKPPPVINLVHPRPVQWAALMQSIGDALVHNNLLTKPLPIVAFEEWFSRLEQKAIGASADDFKEMPALKLLPFMRMIAQSDKSIRKVTSDGEAGGFVVFSTTKAQQLSRTMRELAPITAEDVALWMKYWASKGMFM